MRRPRAPRRLPAGHHVADAQLPQQCEGLLVHGAEQHPQILAEFGGAYDDPELARYVDSIGQFLALTSSASGTRFTFTVLNSPVVNAFALPGGYVYVTRGLIALADNGFPWQVSIGASADRMAFVDEGDMDVLATMKAYQEVGYEHMIVPDHYPRIPGDSRWGHQSRAYQIGYVKALIAATGGETE